MTGVNFATGTEILGNPRSMGDLFIQYKNTMPQPASPDQIEAPFATAGQAGIKRRWRNLVPAVTVFCLLSPLLPARAEADRPNFLWISMEDVSLLRPYLVKRLSTEEGKTGKPPK